MHSIQIDKSGSFQAQHFLFICRLTHRHGTRTFHSKTGLERPENNFINIYFSHALHRSETLRRKIQWKS